MVFQEETYRPVALVWKELIPGYLNDVTGVYQTPQGYYVKDAGR